MTQVAVLNSVVGDLQVGDRVIETYGKYTYTREVTSTKPTPYGTRGGDVLELRLVDETSLSFSEEVVTILVRNGEVVVASPYYGCEFRDLSFQKSDEVRATVG